MAVYDRVAAEPDVVDFATGTLRGTPRAPKRTKTYAIVRKGKRLALREEDGDLARAQNSACVRLGKYVRRYDPDAREREGKLAEFDTVAEATAYVTKWL